MYLHLGQGVVAKTREVIGIFDLDTSTIRKATREFLAAAEKENRVTTVAKEELPKAFVLCASQKIRGDEVFISPLASSTLEKRIELERFI